MSLEWLETANFRRSPAFVPGRKHWNGTVEQFSTVKLSDIPQAASLGGIFLLFSLSSNNCFSPHLSGYLYFYHLCLGKDTVGSLEISKNSYSNSRLFFVLLITLFLSGGVIQIITPLQ